MVAATKERTRAIAASARLVHAWPNQTEASRLLGIDASTLLRRDLPYEEFGGREKRFSPSVVLGEALYYKRVPVQEIAAGLYEVALEHSTRDEAREIAREADAFLREHGELRARELTRAEFLAEARRTMPRGVYRQIESIYLQKHGGSKIRGAFKAGLERVPALVARARKPRRRHV